VGRDKGSLTEQQTERTGTTMTQMRRKHNTNRTTQRAALPDRTRACATKLRVSCPRPAPPTGPQHDGTWYGIPGSAWPGGVSPASCAPSWSPVKINPVLAELRTQHQKTIKNKMFCICFCICFYYFSVCFVTGEGVYPYHCILALV